MSFANNKKSKFLSSFPIASIDSKSDTLAQRCKFNFSYFCHDQSAGQHFSDWNKDQLVKLLDKLASYSQQTLKHWSHAKIGKGKNHVLEIYYDFPKNSEFSHPKHIPHQAQWARFRMESSVRLIGFTIPESYGQKEQGSSKHFFCCNTFYVVFLDKNHVFYKT